MKTLLFCFTLLAATTPALALMPPFFESAREIQTILSDTFWSSFSSEPILSIEKTEGGYNVDTSDHSVFVEIKKTSSRPGPGSFSLKFHTPVLKEISTACTSPTP